MRPIPLLPIDLAIKRRLISGSSIYMLLLGRQLTLSINFLVRLITLFFLASRVIGPKEIKLETKSVTFLYLSLGKEKKNKKRKRKEKKGTSTTQHTSMKHIEYPWNKNTNLLISLDNFREITDFKVMMLTFVCLVNPTQNLAHLFTYR